jgi:hypothetical protein
MCTVPTCGKCEQFLKLFRTDDVSTRNSVVSRVVDYLDQSHVRELRRLQLEAVLVAQGLLHATLKFVHHHRCCHFDWFSIKPELKSKTKLTCKSTDSKKANSLHDHPCRSQQDSDQSGIFCSLVVCYSCMELLFLFSSMRLGCPLAADKEAKCSTPTGFSDSKTNTVNQPSASVSVLV